MKRPSFCQRHHLRSPTLTALLQSRPTFYFGASAFNLFNHPNFDQPVDDISNPKFGSSIAGPGLPTSLVGSLWKPEVRRDFWKS